MQQHGVLLASCVGGSLLYLLLRGLLPGNVLGLTLLLALLIFGAVRLHHVESVADFLLQNMAFFFQPAMLGVLDIMLFAMANCSICYLTMSGHIMATDYKYMIFNYLHFGLTSVLLVGINSAFGLYRSVWYFAGSDEIVKSFLGALVNAVQLFLCDRFLFAKLLHTKGYLPD